MKKTQWIFDKSRAHFYMKNLTTNDWYEQIDNVVYDLKFITYDGDSIILYNEIFFQYIELSDMMVKIAYEYIENLENPESVFSGKWYTSESLSCKSKLLVISLFIGAAKIFLFSKILPILAVYRRLVCLCECVSSTIQPEHIGIFSNICNLMWRVHW